jgi:hypothetical protein
VSGTVIVPWYATGFRSNGFEQALGEVAATALRYGASSYAVYRARDDRYKFQQLAEFDDHVQWERYWYGPEMSQFRTLHSSWYQVPIVYGWWDRTAGGQVHVEGGGEREGRANGNGRGNGAPHGIVEGESA